MTNYVLGFMFNETCDQVILIEKAKPSWQAGCLNGLGGKIEDGETSQWTAMVREYQEEAGVVTRESDWKHYCDLVGEDYMVFVFSCFSDKYFEASITNETERVYRVPVDKLSHNSLVSNVTWLIHLALDENYGEPFRVFVNYVKK